MERVGGLDGSLGSRTAIMTTNLVLGVTAPRAEIVLSEESSDEEGLVGPVESS